MIITDRDKQIVIEALASNPRFASQPLTTRVLCEKTGFTIPKLSAVKTLLLNEGRIWEFRDTNRKPFVYLQVPDKKEQIVDVLKRYAVIAGFDFSRLGERLTRDVGIHRDLLHDILLRLHADGLLRITDMQVALTPWFLERIAEERKVH